MIATAAPRQINMAEELIALSDIPDSLPKLKSGRKVSWVTVHRWISRGLAGVAPLETMRIGGGDLHEQAGPGTVLRAGERGQGWSPPRA